MNWRHRALKVVAALFYLASSIWYIAIWINGGEFRRYFVANAVFLCLSSFLAWMVYASKWRLRKTATPSFKKWFTSWFAFGFAWAVLLFVLERILSFPVSEPFLFTTWPSYLMLMIPGPWDVLSFLFLLLSFVTNAALFSAWSSLIWWLIHLLPTFSSPPTQGNTTDILHLH